MDSLLVATLEDERKCAKQNHQWLQTYWGKYISKKSNQNNVKKNDAPTCLPITGLARGAPHPMNNLLYNYLDRLFK